MEGSKSLVLRQRTKTRVHSVPWTKARRGSTASRRSILGESKSLILRWWAKAHLPHLGSPLLYWWRSSPWHVRHGFHIPAHAYTQFQPRSSRDCYLTRWRMTRQGVFHRLKVLTTQQSSLSSLSHSAAGGVSRLSKAIFETKVLTVCFLTVAQAFLPTSDDESLPCTEPWQNGATKVY